MRSGYVDISKGYSGSMGTNGFGWCQVATSKVWSSAGLGAYRISSDVSNVNPSGGPSARWNAFPLRWLVELLILVKVQIRFLSVNL